MESDAIDVQIEVARMLRRIFGRNSVKKWKTGRSIHSKARKKMKFIMCP